MSDRTDHDPFVLPGDTAPTGDKLQKFLSAAGVASRRHAETMIRQGRVTVNGDVATLGMRVQPGDRVCVGGVEVGPQAPRHFLLNKPVGVVTTLDDPQGRPTVAQLVPDDVRVYPVGRLDVDTSGLLLLTNDGELAHRLMHPSFGVVKTYRALVEGCVSDATARKLAAGIELEDGPTAPAVVRVIDVGRDQSVVELQLHEGRNRQVRRMCDAAGHPVVELCRTGYGPLTLTQVAPGTSRPLTAPEIRRLRKAAGLAPPRSSDRTGSRAERRAAQRAAAAQELEDASGGGSAPQQEPVDGDRDANPSGAGHGDQSGAAKQPGRGSTKAGASKGRAARGSRAGRRGDGRDDLGS